MKYKDQIVDTLTLKQFRDYLSNSVTIRAFADNHEMVYFGSAINDDESKLIRGVTVSNTYKDSHYAVGTAIGRDVVFVQRTDSICMLAKKRNEIYTWNILSIDLRTNEALPHIYIEGRARHGAGFYEILAIKQREFIELPKSFMSRYDPLFSERFATRLLATTSFEFSNLVKPSTGAVLAHHFSLFDYEVNGHELYVYLLSKRPTAKQLEYMLNAGAWFARELENSIDDKTLLADK